MSIFFAILSATMIMMMITITIATITHQGMIVVTGTSICTHQ